MKNKYYFNFINLFLFIILISQISSKFLSKRILINNTTNIVNSNILNYANNKNFEPELDNEHNLKNKKENVGEDPGSYLLGWFFIFFFMGCYMVCKMKDYEETRDKTDQVWKFMFMANNGTLIVAGINIFNIHNMYLDSSPFLIGSIVFIIGGIYYIRYFISNCNANFAEDYFNSNPFEYWKGIPCFIWEFIGLTDPCCRSESYTVYHYEDGHTESNYCWHAMWNVIIKIIKRFAFFFTVISYYISIIFLMMFWYLIKLIYNLTKKYCNKNQEVDVNKENKESKPNINQNSKINMISDNPNNNMNNNVSISIQNYGNSSSDRKDFIPNKINNDNTENNNISNLSYPGKKDLKLNLNDDSNENNLPNKEDLEINIVGNFNSKNIFKKQKNFSCNPDIAIPKINYDAGKNKIKKENNLSKKEKIINNIHNKENINNENKINDGNSLDNENITESSLNNENKECPAPKLNAFGKYFNKES